MRSIRRKWEAHFLPLEFLSSVIITVAFVVWSEYFSGQLATDQLLSGNRGAIYGALSAIFGALLGFVITAVSIVLGYATSARLEILRGRKHYNELWDIYKSAMKALAAATIAGLFGLIFDRDSHPMPVILYVNVLTSTLAFFRLGRSIWALENIIGIVTRPS